MKTNVVVLAAGNSTRYKENKLLCIFNEKPLIEHLFILLSELDVNGVYVVTQYEGVAELAEKYNFQVVYNEYPEQGMSYSIKLGVNVCQHNEQIMFVVADQPFLQKQTLLKLLHSSDGQHIVCCECENRLQNPMIFSKSYYEQLLSLTNEQGGRHIACHEDVIKVQVDKQELFDIDTKEDYEKALK